MLSREKTFPHKCQFWTELEKEKKYKEVDAIDKII